MGAAATTASVLKGAGERQGQLEDEYSVVAARILY